MQLPKFLRLGSDGDIVLTGHRIGLHHVIHHYNEGYSPEMLTEQFPSLPLALVHKVIAFYLDHRPELDGYMVQYESDLERIHNECKQVDWDILRDRFAKLQSADAVARE